MPPSPPSFASSTCRSWPTSPCCRVLPLHAGALHAWVVARLDPAKRRLTVYDQLNPAYAKYYSRDEATRLLARAGFKDVTLYHRHGYSWSLVGTKP